MLLLEQLWKLKRGRVCKIRLACERSLVCVVCVDYKYVFVGFVVEFCFSQVTSYLIDTGIKH